MEIVCAGTGVFAQNGNVRMYNVNIGGNADIGLSVDGGHFLHVKNTDFNGCSIGMEVRNHSGIAAGFPRIEDSRFSNCWHGFDMYGGRYLNILNSDFSECSGQAIWLQDISNYVGFTNSTVTGMGGFSDVSPGSPIADLLLDGHSDGIRLHNVPRFRMSGGSISRCSTGIFVPAFSRSNIILTNKAIIENNQIGVHVQSGFRLMNSGTVSNFGMVMMDCARLLDNYLGIAGINVLLQIDAFANSGTKNPAFVRSNHFRITTDGNFARKLFFVCYDGTQYIPATISATGNFWENTVDGPTPSWRLFNSTIAQAPPAGCFVMNSPNNVALIRNPVVFEMPQTCPTSPNLPDPPSTGEFACLPPPSSDINGVLHQQFFKGYKQFTLDAEGSGEFSASDMLFKPLADINDVDVSSMMAGCQSFVLAAQAFVPGNPLPFGGDGSERAVTSSASHPFLFASPNPTPGHLSIALPDAPCILRVFDSYGRIVHQMQPFGGTASLDGSAWPNGIYTVEAISADFREQIKIVIQR
ncbi:MAG: right-handed parallel beta-helix repeat-containing protein [Saprospiraceae bacterium]